LTDSVAARTARVAVIERRGKFLVAEPFFAPGPRMAVSRDTRYDVGDLVAVAPGAPGRHGGRGGRAKVTRRLGRPDVARDVIEGLMVDRGLARRVDPAVARAARLASEAPVSASPGGAAGGGDPGGGDPGGGDPGGGDPADGVVRRDLRDLPTFTIDPVTARDFDDAISAVEEPSGGGWRVWVHIADVSAYVSPRSPVDREAYRRGTSVYVPGAVEPMLPTELSNGACSLAPGVDRYAVSVEMVVRGESVLSAAFARSVIRSDMRLTYDDVDAIFAGSARASGEWGTGLACARAAARARGERRVAAGALELEGASEPEFEFDRDGHVVAVRGVEQTESHRLIEYLMIAANEQVARFLSDRRVPALYRVHERPEATAVERMIDQLASLDVPTPPVGGNLTPQQAAEVAGEASQMVAAWVAARGGRGARALNRIVLRSLKQAYYDHQNRGHAGLQLGHYCHFTSPIRRYPDLICHRALLSAVTGDEPVPESSWVAAAGPVCSAQERAAMMIERDADDIARCFLLERELFAAPRGHETVFEGEVVGVIGAGAFVAFGAGGPGAFEGLLPVRRMRDDWWELNEWQTALIGTRSGGALRLGDPVAVRVGGIDAPRGRVDLLPVDSSEH
jgi:ribonuclease R